MKAIKVKKHTIVQSYGEFFMIYVYFKNVLNSDVKLDNYFTKTSALVMLCFSIEGFVNHIGERIFKSWKSIERGMSPVGKLKLIMETLKIEPEYEKDPFNTVNQIMQWRNVVAHAKTEKWETEKIVRNETEAKMAQWLNERTDWQLFAIKLDLEKVGSTCTRLMQTIHEKAYGNMDGFLMATSEGSDTEEIEIDSIPK